MTDNQIEQEIQAKGLTAPRVTPADIEANIASEHYFTAQDMAADGIRAQAGSGYGGRTVKSVTTETIATSFGPAVAQVIGNGGTHVQYNCFLPPCGGAGIFAMMSADLSGDECSDTMRALIESGPHAENLDLTSIHRNLEAAGTVNMAQINLTKLMEEKINA